MFSHLIFGSVLGLRFINIDSRNSSSSFQLLDGILLYASTASYLPIILPMDMLIYIPTTSNAAVGILVISHMPNCPGLYGRKQLSLLLVNSTAVLPRSKAQPHPYCIHSAWHFIYIYIKSLL